MVFSGYMKQEQGERVVLGIALGMSRFFSEAAITIVTIYGTTNQCCLF